MTPSEVKAMYERMRAFSRAHSIKVVTPHQSPSFHRDRPQETDVVIIDYLDVLPRKQTQAKE